MSVRLGALGLAGVWVACVLACSDQEVTLGEYVGSAGAGGAPPADAAAESAGGSAAAFGTEGTYTQDAGVCVTCGQVITGQTQILLCTDNGPPSSADLFNAYIYHCGCENCLTECEQTCILGSYWTVACRNCMNANCADEKAACEADKPGAAGAGGGAGNAGSSGAGGSAGSSSGGSAGSTDAGLDADPGDAAGD